MKNKLSKQIEAAYYRHADGTRINVLDIPKLFDDVLRDIQAGKPIDTSVIEAISRYRA